ncbi:hypothetical protein N7528_008744 [Penicillium herquei]|nr:hypothetical protein N7528_008744 [Penicillium herquei]
MGNKISRKTVQDTGHNAEVNRKVETNTDVSISQQPEQPKCPPLQLANKPTAERFLEKIIEANDSNVLLNALKSEDFTFSEKTEALRGLTKHFHRTKLTWNDLFWIESQLEEAGLLNVVQSLRWTHYRLSSWESESVQQILEADIKTQWLVQREICVNQRKQTLQNQIESPPAYNEQNESSNSDSSSKEEITKQLASCNQDLKDLNTSYWEHQNKLHRIKSEWRVRPAKEAYTLLHETDNWYLNRFTIRHCKGGNGCCSRSCGCCERDRETKRKEKMGHCTSACPCCLKFKNLPESPEMTDLADFPFDTSAQKATGLTDMLLKAHIFANDIEECEESQAGEDQVPDKSEAHQND